MPFTPAEPSAISVMPELSGTTSAVVEILVTAAPEPTIYLLPNLSLSTAAVGTGAQSEDAATPTGVAADGPSASSIAVASGDASGAATPSGSASGSAAGSDEASASASAPAQQTANVGAKKAWPVFAAAAVGVGACAMIL